VAVRRGPFRNSGRVVRGHVYVGRQKQFGHLQYLNARGFQLESNQMSVPSRQVLDSRTEAR
jgi:hypothetical protein